MLLRSNWMNRLTAALRRLSSYAAIVPALPGGTLIFASFLTLRHGQWFVFHAHRLLALVRRSEHIL